MAQQQWLTPAVALPTLATFEVAERGRWVPREQNNVLLEQAGKGEDQRVSDKGFLSLECGQRGVDISALDIVGATARAGQDLQLLADVPPEEGVVVPVPGREVLVGLGHLVDEGLKAGVRVRGGWLAGSESASGLLGGQPLLSSRHVLHVILCLFGW